MLQVSQQAAAAAAAAAAPASSAFEGEAMTRSTTDTSKIRVQTESGASAGKTLAFLTLTHATKQYTTAWAVDYVTLRMRGDQCQGAPRALVSIDGLTAATIDVPGTSYGDYQFALAPAGNGKAGAHTLKVQFSNDFAAAPCNRNLYLDKVTLLEVAVPPFEGESMLRSSWDTNRTRVQADASASAGQSLRFGALSWGIRQYRTTLAADQMTLRMRGDLCQGAPRAVVSVDGVTAATIDVPVTSYRDYPFALAPAGNGKAGTHTLKVHFVNDYYVSSACNRNLHLDTVAVRQQSLPPPPPPPTPPPTPPPPAPPAEVGRWTPGFTIPRVAVHAALLPTGKILYYRLDAFVLDPATGTTRQVNPPGNVYCSGISHLADGRILVTGGTGAPNTGTRTVQTFDPFTETWTRHPDMRSGRWYPTQVLLPDRNALILGGWTESGVNHNNMDIELFDPSANITGLFGVRGGAGQPPAGGLYPHLFVVPSGRVLVAGPESTDSFLLSIRGNSSPVSWLDIPNLAEWRGRATGVLLPGGSGGSTKALLTGGGSYPPHSTSVVFDEANPAGGWQPGPGLRVGRAHHNTVLLPDGSMVTVGGGHGKKDGDIYSAEPAQRQIELYNPTTSSWRLGPSQSEVRTYHSTALLLPDGRVFSAGDDRNGGGSASDIVEIYEPPYLFKGPRPTISSAPSSVDYGDTFTVGTPNTNVTRAVLVAPGAATHAVDMNQRYVALAVNRPADGSTVELLAPANANIAPPGYYMLFLVNDQGVPSTAKFVQLLAHNDAPAVTTTGSALPYNEGDAATAIDSALTATDVDDWLLVGAVVRISSGFESGDELIFTDQSGITGAFDSDTGRLALSGIASIADYESALRSVGFRHAGDDPSSSRTVEFTADDGDDKSAPATRAISINAVNDPPSASGDSGATDEDTVLEVAAPGVLANDTDPDAGDTKAVVQLNGSTSLTGTSTDGALVTVADDGSFSYDPSTIYQHLAAGDSESDSFEYTVADGAGAESTATVTITITGRNDGPTATGDAATTDEDTPLAVPAPGVLANDTDPDAGDTKAVVQLNGLTTLTGLSADGALVTIAADGSYSYDPGLVYQSLTPGEQETDTFTYTMQDSSGAESTATVEITITGVEDAPTVDLTGSKPAFTGLDLVFAAAARFQA